MKTEILLSGFGGQGLLSLGRILAKAALKENKYTTWFPSYGGEVRGGTAYCFVNISKEPIASPLIEHPDIAIILNQPSLDKFEKKIKKGGLLILNGDLSQKKPLRKDIKKVILPLNQIALDCGSIKAANIVALGALIPLVPNLLKDKSVTEALGETFGQKSILEINLKALTEGKKYAKG